MKDFTDAPDEARPPMPPVDLADCERQAQVEARMFREPELTCPCCHLRGMVTVLRLGHTAADDRWQTEPCHFARKK